MGAVSVDVHKKERNFKDLNLSDGNVVKYLIQFRNKIDKSYNSNINVNIFEAGDNFDFNEELIVLYSSLDKVVKSCNFTKQQERLLNLLFEGYTFVDIAEIHNINQLSMYAMFRRIIDKIVAKNNEDWINVYGCQKRGKQM